jgi:hypothetical protein
MKRIFTRWVAGVSVFSVASLATIALVAAPAGAATAEPVPVATGPAVFVGPTSAVLTGAIETAGEPTIYDFQYGTTTGYGQQTAYVGVKSTSSLTVAEGVLTGLKPSTTYHFRLVAEALGSQASGYYYTAPGVGNDGTFTTASAGKLTLSSTNLKVTKAGKTSFTLKSASTLAAKGKATITVKVKKKTYTLLSKSFSVKAGGSSTISGTLSAEGKKLLKAAKSHKLKATLKVTTSTYQPTITKTVTLKS